MAVAVPSREEAAVVPSPVTASKAAALGADDVLARLGSGTKGLAEGEAARRLRVVGPNAVRSHRVHALSVLASQLRSPLLMLLAVTALFGTAQDARVPSLGASGAIAAVLGAYYILYSGSRVTTWIFPVFLVRIPAWVYLGLWFLYQFIEANFGLFNAKANGGGVAFFAHVGGFIFGLLITRLRVRAGQIMPQARYADSPL
jgi:membrane associated rhomboid family serine protease